MAHNERGLRHLRGPDSPNNRFGGIGARRRPGKRSLPDEARGFRRFRGSMEFSDEQVPMEIPGLEMLPSHLPAIRRKSRNGIRGDGQNSHRRVKEDHCERHVTKMGRVEEALRYRQLDHSSSSFRTAHQTKVLSSIVPFAGCLALWYTRLSVNVLQIPCS